MLVLSRKPTESILITTPSGDVIRVLVDSIRGNRVSIGFEADRKIVIKRAELSLPPSNPEGTTNNDCQ